MTEHTAKYLAVADTLKREILNGKYESHERFPSEEALARRFGASRPTVERALRELKREGLLESRSGSGSYLTFAARNAATRNIRFLTQPNYASTIRARIQGVAQAAIMVVRRST